LRLGRVTPDGGGGTDYQVFSIHLKHGPPCTLWGVPRVRFLDSAGTPLAFPTTQHWLGRERHGPVRVSAGHPTAFPVAKYRCDTTPDPPIAASVVVTLPDAAGTLRGVIPATAARLAYCPGDGGDQRVHVGAIGGWQLSTTASPTRVAVSMHSRLAPQGLPTWGRADLDGDGSPDLVVVRPSGRTVALIGSRVLHARVPGRPTDRLQGFTDLTGDGRPEILVGATALGCDAGYRFCATRPTVLTLLDGRLRVVRFPEPAVSWDNGQGDLFAGVVCSAHGPTQVEVLMTGGNGYEMISTTYRVAGVTAHVVDRTTVHGAGTYRHLAALAATRCPGLAVDGWAPERGPLG
jgi:hypothetical protein